MSQRKKVWPQLIVLLISVGLIIWHTTYWHLSGVHTTLYNYIKEGRGYLAVLYNMGLITVSGLLLGLLMNKIFKLANSKKSEV